MIKTFNFKGHYLIKESLISILFLVFLSFCNQVDAAPGSVEKKFPSNLKTCTGAAFDGKLLWLADHSLDVLVAVEPSTGKELRRIKSPGYRPAGLAFDGQQLWNVDTSTAQLYRIRTNDALTTRVIPSPVAVPHALAFDGKNLWVSDDATRAIHQVDPEDGTTISEIPFPSKSVDGLAFDGKYLWAADRLSDQLYAIDVPSAQVVATLPAPGPYSSGLAFIKNRLIVTDYQTDEVYLISTDDTTHVIKTDPKVEWVVFTSQLRNFGPDTVPSAQLLLAIPGKTIGQDLLEGPVFEPKGFLTKTDQWNQRVAVFNFNDLRPGKWATVKMTVKVRAWSVHHVIYPHKVYGLGKIPPAIRKRYLKDESKYLIHNPVIRAAVKEAVGRERNPYWIARKIYGYIHKKMHYEMLGGWDVAPKVLKRGSGSCSEYSFVFIAMCRAAGLPARYSGSLVVRRDDASYDDVFHRWVEVYLPPYGWIPVDPSRGDKPTEAQRADSFGHLYHDFLVTTHGGGASDLMDWNYNSNFRYTCAGRCKVETESIAEWSPENPGKTNQVLQKPATRDEQIFNPQETESCGSP